MNKEDVGSKRPLSHGNVTDLKAKEKESSEIERHTEEFLKAGGKVKKMAKFIAKVFKA